MAVIGDLVYTLLCCDLRLQGLKRTVSFSVASLLYYELWLQSLGEAFVALL